MFRLLRQFQMDKSLGDDAYRGHHDTVSTANSHNTYGVKKFKSRALKRHEDFNGMTKTFNILQHRFRHGVDKIAKAFESVAVICQYKVESDEPLFDVLIEDLVNPEHDEESDYGSLEEEEEDY